MANEEQLALLKEGVEGWNKWRGEHPEILPDLGGTHLSKTNLSGAHLHFAHLTEADLNQTTYPVEIVA